MCCGYEQKKSFLRLLSTQDYLSLCCSFMRIVQILSMGQNLSTLENTTDSHIKIILLDIIDVHFYSLQLLCKVILSNSRCTFTKIDS